MVWGAHGESLLTALSFVPSSESKFRRLRTTLDSGVWCLHVRWRKKCINTCEPWRLITFTLVRCGWIPKWSSSGGLSPHLKTLHQQSYFCQHDAFIQEKIKMATYRNLKLTLLVMLDLLGTLCKHVIIGYVLCCICTLGRCALGIQQ